MREKSEIDKDTIVIVNEWIRWRIGYKCEINQWPSKGQCFFIQP